MGSSYKLDQSIPVQMPFYISMMMVPFFCRFWKRLASLYSHHVLVVITVVCLAMGHVAVARRTSCLEQIKARVSCHGFVKICSKELHVMMMIHLSELKSGIIRGLLYLHGLEKSFIEFSFMGKSLHFRIALSFCQ